MPTRVSTSPGIAIPGLILICSLCLCLCGSGCVRNSIQAARRKSGTEFREHLRAVPSGTETPAQTAQTAALRQRLLHDEWLERGYRVGNEQGGTPILYSAAGKDLWSGLWYP